LGGGKWGEVIFRSVAALGGALMEGKRSAEKPYLGVERRGIGCRGT